MTTVAILPETIAGNGTVYRAMGGGLQSVGRSAGEALDALSARLGDQGTGTLVVIQSFSPDRFFGPDRRKRLEDLMDAWRRARDAGASLPPAEQVELEALTQAEAAAALERTKELRRELAA